MTRDPHVRIKGTDETGRATKSAKRNFKSLASAAMKMLGPLAAVAGVAGLGLLAKNALDSADKVQKLGQQLRVSTEFLSEMRHVAKLTGVSFETVAKGIKFMQKNLSDAADGLSTAKRAFAETGIEIADLMKMKPDEAFERLGDAISKIEDPARRTQVAMNVFGRAGTELLATFNEGADGIRRMREEAHKLGLTLSQEDADAAAAANDAMVRLKGATEGLTQSMTISLAPALEATADFLSVAIPKATQFTIDAFHNMSVMILNDMITITKHRGWAELAKGMAGMGGPGGAIGDAAARISAAGDAGVAALEEMRLKHLAVVGDVQKFKVGDTPDVSGGGDTGGQERRNKLAAAGARLTASLRTEQEKMNAAIGQAGLLADQGFITPETFDRVMAQYDQQITKVEELDNAASQSMDRIRSISQRASDDIYDTFASAITGTEDLLDGLEDAFRSLVKQLIILGLNQIFPGLGTVVGASTGGSGPGHIEGYGPPSKGDPFTGSTKGVGNTYNIEIKTNESVFTDDLVLTRVAEKIAQKTEQLNTTFYAGATA